MKKPTIIGLSLKANMGKLTFLTVFLFLFVLLWIQPSEAQKSSPPQDKPIYVADGREPGWQSSSLNLTEAQTKALENLRRTYMVEAIPIRTGLFALKIELRHLLSYPNVQPQILFDQQRKISALQAKLEELSLSYQVKARSIFTKEQLERLLQGWAFEMGLGYEIPIMDMGRRFKKGPQ
jgi:Spy/CpxP family protein refolding chaperone